MPHIDWIDEARATGELAEVYRRWRAANPHRAEVPAIFKTMSHSPALLTAMMQASYEVHFRDGSLTQRQKEMIATYVSGLNRCPY